MTTRQLAEQIARAVLKEIDSDESTLAPHDSYFNPQWREAGWTTPDLTAAVFDVLRAQGCWFCRKSEDPKQGTLLEQMEEVR